MKRDRMCGRKQGFVECSLENCCHDAWPAPDPPCTADETLLDSKSFFTAACCSSCTSWNLPDTCAEFIPVITGKGCLQKCALVWTAETRARTLDPLKCTVAEKKELATAVAADLAAAELGGAVKCQSIKNVKGFCNDGSGINKIVDDTKLTTDCVGGKFCDSKRDIETCCKVGTVDLKPLYNRMCQTPKKYLGESTIKIDRFMGKCDQFFPTVRSFGAQFPWTSATCDSFSTDEQKLLLSKMNDCCSDGKNVCGSSPPKCTDTCTPEELEVSLQIFVLHTFVCCLILALCTLYFY